MSASQTRSGLAAVGYVFGTIGARAVPGTVLVPLLVDLGMSTSAARTLLHRMREAGSLITERSGRIAVYRLAGGYLERYQGIAFGVGTVSWSGAYDAILYDIPETHRAERDQLRERAFTAGFGAPRSGLLIGVSDPKEWAGAWLHRDNLAVEQLRLGCDLATARRLAEQAWGLAAIAAEIEDFMGRLEAIGDRLSAWRSSNRRALSALYELWQEFVRIQMQVPSLPAELYPKGWGLSAMQTKMYGIKDVLLPLAKQHAETVIDGASAAPLVELESRPHNREQEV